MSSSIFLRIGEHKTEWSNFNFHGGSWWFGIRIGVSLSNISLGDSRKPNHQPTPFAEKCNSLKNIKPMYRGLLLHIGVDSGALFVLTTRQLLIYLFRFQTSCYILLHSNVLGWLIVILAMACYNTVIQ